jgi:hypothetical protein
MPTPTYTLIDSVTLGSSAASVTFSSIPQTYGDLVLTINATTAGNTAAGVRFNNDSSDNYYTILMDGNGSSASTVKLNPADAARFTYNLTLNTSPSLVRIQILDATATDKHKSLLIRADRADQATAVVASRWGSTAAINKIDILQFSLQDFTTGSTFFLYGIAKAL